jgi:SAM-dependent methyltransferase
VDVTDAAMADASRAVYDRDAADYSPLRQPERAALDTLELQRPEQVLLRRLGGRWADLSVLDLGVGAGRTAYTFAPIAGRYVGVDYSPRMVELSRELIGEDESIRFLVGDAREIADVLGERFDVVLFSFNGIDSVSHGDRLRILEQVRRACRDEGYFFFSSHSLRSLPFSVDPPRFVPHRPLRSLYRSLRSLPLEIRTRKLNASVNRDVIEQRGWTLLRDGAHGFDLELYYVTPGYQVRQLADAGFGHVEVLDARGRTVDARDPGADRWLSYLCRPTASGEAGLDR